MFESHANDPLLTPADAFETFHEHPDMARGAAPEQESASAEGSVSEDAARLDPGDDFEPPDMEMYAVWVALVERIHSGKIDGMSELYEMFSRGIRFHLCRHPGTQDLDDRVHDAFVMVVQSIRRGELREPQRLMGFVRTVVRRLVATHIEKAVQARREHQDKS